MAKLGHQVRIERATELAKRFIRLNCWSAEDAIRVAAMQYDIHPHLITYTVTHYAKDECKEGS